MKKTIVYFSAAFVLVLLSALCPGKVRGDDIFLAEVERAVDQAIPAWIAGDNKKLSAALQRLTRNEAYRMVTGKAANKGYVAVIPKSVNTDPNAVAACLFLIRREREGTPLWPRSFFEGQRFQFCRKGGK